MNLAARPLLIRSQLVRPFQAIPRRRDNSSASRRYISDYIEDTVS